ncbi:MAG: ornithine cyclodeaminase family protein [Gaiellaceae bacterium]
MPPYLTETEVAELLTPAEAFAAVESSLARLARGEVDNPLRLQLPIEDGRFAVMPCVDRGLGYAGLKTYAWTPVGSTFLVVLLSIEPPEVAAIVEAAHLGELRTAAASGVAARRLARPGSRTLGLIGCGRQAAAHVEALRQVLPTLERSIAYCRNEQSLEAFCAAHRCEPAASPSDAGACDIVVTATTSATAVLHGEWLTAGALVVSVGANAAAARELDDAVLERAAFVCTDSRPQAMHEAGDVIAGVERGLFDASALHELQEVVAGTVTGRKTAGDVVVFKSNGLAAWDLAAAARVVELARAR